jgi:hypothetical protein
MTNPDPRVTRFVDAAVANGFTLPDKLGTKEIDDLDLAFLLDEAGVPTSEDREVIPLIDAFLADLAAS